MGRQVSLELRGQRLSAEVTDSDLIFFLGIFFLTAEERDRLQKSGSDGVMQSLAARQQAQLDEAIANELKAKGVSEVTKEVEEEANKKLNQVIGEALIHRINFDGYVRVEAAQRFTEIFPDINPSVVYFEDKIDQKGDRSRRGRIRLETAELLDLVLAVLGDAKEEAAKEKAIAQTPVAPPEPKPEPVDIKKEIAAAQPVRPEIVGFQKTESAASSAIIPAAPGTIDDEIAALLPQLSDGAKAKLGLT